MSKFFDAFISYGRADSQGLAIKLYEKLTDKGFRVWLDQNDIPLAVDFQNQINDGIEKSHNFIFIISPHSVNSPYCLKEIKLAVEYHKRIIPLLHVEKISQQVWQQRHPQGTDEEWQVYQAKGLHSIFPNMHPEIGKINWIYSQEGINDFDQALLGLIESIQRHQDYVETHTDLLVKSLTWLRNNQVTRDLLVGEEKLRAENWLKYRFTGELPPCTPTDLHGYFICESIKNAENLMTKVFIAAAHEDRPIQQKITQSLMRNAWTTWTNSPDIYPQNEDYFASDKIREAIEKADNFIVLLSAYFTKNKSNKRLLLYAQENQKRIIIILLQDIDVDFLSLGLRHPIIIDGKNLEIPLKYENFVEELLKELHRDSVYYSNHKVLLVQALKWQQQDYNPSLLLRGYNLQHFEAWLKLAQNRTDHPALAIQKRFIIVSRERPNDGTIEVFISYSRSDSDFARRLNNSLQEIGKTTWFDQESIASGVDFQQEIYRGIENSDNFLFIISKKSIDSPYCVDEVTYAEKLNKRIITLLYQSVDSAVMPANLKKIQWIDFRPNKGDFLLHFNELIRTLDTDRDHVRNHTKWFQRALEWQHKQENMDLLLRGSEFAIAYGWLQEAEDKEKSPPANELQKKFIQASQQAITAARQREKRQQILLKTLLGLMTGAFLFALGISIYALREATLSKLREAVIQSNFLLYSQPLEGMLLTLKTTGHNQRSPFVRRILPQVQSNLYEAIRLSKEENRLTGHQQEVNTVAITPDGKKIISGSSDGTIRLWNLAGAPLGKPLQTQQQAVQSIAISPDGQWLVSGGNNGTIELWSLSGQRRSQPIPSSLPVSTGHGSVTSVAISPNGQYIVTGGSDKTLRLWTPEGKPIGQPLKGHTEGIYAIAISPDNRYIVSGSWDKTLRLWSFDGKPLGEPLRGHENGVSALAISPDGQYIVSGSYDETVRLWTPAGTPIGEPLRGHQGVVTAIAISGDGEYIISGSGDRTIRLWTREGNPVDEPFRGHEDIVTSLAFTPDGQKIISGSSDKTLRIWTREGLFWVDHLRGHSTGVTALAISPNSERIISGGLDGTVRFWSSQGQEIRKSEKRQQTNITALAMSPKGDYIVTGSGLGTVQLWSNNGEPVGPVIQAHPKGIGVTAIVFCPDGKCFATTGYDGTIRLWSNQGKSISKPIKVNDTGLLALAISPDGKMLISGGYDQALQLWTISGKPLSKPIKINDVVNAVSISPDGKYFVSGSNNGTINLWTLKGEPIGETIRGHEDAVTALAISPDGEYFVSGGLDGMMHLWTREGHPLGDFIQGHYKGITDIAFSPDGQYFATSSSDGKIRLWLAGNWKTWLNVACHRLRHHPSLLNPTTSIAKEAASTCGF